MHRNRLILIIIIGTITACTSSSNNAQEQVDGTDKKTTENIPDSRQAELKQNIQGLWARSTEENASFRIKGDSLYFFEDPIPIFFEIKGDSFIYYLEKEKFHNQIIKLQHDSIIFRENGTLIKLYNRDK